MNLTNATPEQKLEDMKKQIEKNGKAVIKELRKNATFKQVKIHIAEAEKSQKKANKEAAKAKAKAVKEAAKAAKEAAKAAKPPRNNVLGRLSTMQYEAGKDFMKYTPSHTQPKFTKKDKEKKEEIWGYTGKCSAFSKKICKGVGDHMYGIREGLYHSGAFGGGMGADDPWNKINCVKEENDGEECWKKVTIDGVELSLIYDSFTEEQKIKMKEQDPTKWRNYNCWIRWKEYAESQGAKCFFPNMKDKDEQMRIIVQKHLEAMNEELMLCYLE